MTAASSSETVLIYRDIILPSSETFVVAQSQGLSHYKPFFVGSRSVPGLKVPAEACYLINKGGWLGKGAEVLFKVFDRLCPVQVAALRRVKPLLIHAHFGPDGIQAQTLAKALGIPLIVTFHGYDATTKMEFARRSFFTHRKYARKKHRLFNASAKFVAVSHFIKQKVVEQGFPEEQIQVHYIGIDTSRFQPDLELTREPVVLFVARLVEKKGCDYLLRAMREVQASFPDVEVVIIGDGPLRESLEAQAAKSLKRYRFLGAQPMEVVREWMNRAKVFCVPSITAESGDAEGFGMVFAEAQAMGLPVVSFASGGIPEAVWHGETGLLAPERDVEELTRHLMRLLGDEDLWLSMSRMGQSWVRERFDLTRQTHLLEEIYHTVIRESRGLESRCGGIINPRNNEGGRTPARADK
jgi:colanic acid/amylovoran biosynthesis glycosyltransferase